MPSFALSGSPNWKEQPTNFVAPANAPASTIVWSRLECTYQLATSTTMTLRMRMSGRRRAKSTVSAPRWSASCPRAASDRPEKRVPRSPRSAAQSPSPFVLPCAHCGASRLRFQGPEHARKPAAAATSPPIAVPSPVRVTMGRIRRSETPIRVPEAHSLAARARIEYAEASVRDRSPPWQLEWEAFSRSWLFRKTLPRLSSRRWVAQHALPDDGVATNR